jgi:phage shock protein PspC (stress-responsive transcriptional regulator)
MKVGRNPAPTRSRSTTVNETSPGNGPPTSTLPPRPPLRRPREGRLIAGVAAGVADHVGMDVAIVRILFVVATIFTSGAGVAAYALAWILIPEASPTDPAREPAPVRREIGGRDPMFWVGVGSLVLGVVWLLDRMNFSPFGLWLRPDRGLLVPLVLIGFGIALWRASDTERRRAPTSAPPQAPTSPAVWQQEALTSSSFRPPQETLVIDEPTRGDPELDRDTAIISRTPGPDAEAPGHAGPSSSEGAPLPPPGFSPPPGPPTAQGGSWSPPPVPTKESSFLLRSTLGLALVTAGVLWLLRIADVITLGPGRIIAAALLVVGVGLLVGSVAGRGRGLIGVGLVLLPIVLIAQMVYPFSFEPGDFRQGAGEYTVAPTTVAELERSYQVGAGELTLDLSDLELTGTEEVSVQVGFGQATVIVPSDVSVEITGQIAGGELTAFGRTSSGLGVERTIVDEVDDPVGQLELEVQVGFGQVNVRRAPAPPTAEGS